MNGTPTTPTITGLVGVQDVAVDASGNIYVPSVSSTVSIYSANGTVLRSIIGNGMFIPTSIAVDAAGKIYVGQPGNPGTGVVTTYAANGTPTTPTITGLTDPTGVVIDAGKIYVANSLNGTVTTYTPNGTPTTPTITGLSAPVGVAVRH